MSGCCDVLISDSPNNVLIEASGSDTLVLTDTDEIVLHDSDLDLLFIYEPSVLVISDCVGTPGIPGPPGPSGGLIDVVAGENISQYSVVRILADGQGYLADRNDLTHGAFVAGIATISALTGEDVTIITDGLLNTPVLWTLGPLFVGDAGALISTPPPGTFTDYQLQVAVAVTTSQLLVRPQFPIFNP